MRGAMHSIALAILFSGRRDIQEYFEYRLWAYCAIGPPSGLYADGYQELTCETRGYWYTHVFQYCPLYVEFYGTGLVLGSEPRAEKFRLL